MRVLNQAVHSPWVDQLRDPKQRRFWMLGGVAIFLHTIADPISTYVVVVILNAGHEINPILATPLNQSLTAFVVVHIPLWIVSIGITAMFAILLEKSPAEDLDTIVHYGEVVWFGIILWGTVLVGNNLFVLASAG